MRMRARSLLVLIFYAVIAYVALDRWSGGREAATLPVATRVHQAYRTSFAIVDWRSRRGSYVSRPRDDLYGWRFLIAPYGDQWRVDYQFKQPWNSCDNWVAAHIEEIATGVPDRERTIFVFVEDTGNPRDPLTPIPPAGPSPADTIRCIEVVHAGRHWAGRWDLTVADLKDLLNTGKTVDGIELTADSFHVILDDGTVLQIARSIPFQKIAPFFASESTEKRDLQAELAPYIVARPRLFE